MANPPTTFTNVRITGDLEVEGNLNTPTGTIAATDIQVAAYVAGGIVAGNLQAVLEALADRIVLVEAAV